MSGHKGIYDDILCYELGVGKSKKCKSKLNHIVSDRKFKKWLENNLLSVLGNSVDNVKTRRDIKESGLEVLFKSFTSSLGGQVSGEKRVKLSISQLYQKEPFLERNKKFSGDGKKKRFLVHRTPNVVTWHNMKKAYDGRGNFLITRPNSDIEVAGSGAGVYFSAQQSFGYGPYSIAIELYKDKSLVVGKYFDSLQEYVLKDKAPIIRIMRERDIKAWDIFHTCEKTSGAV